MEFNLSEYIQYKDLDDFNCEFIDVKKIKKFIRLLKEEFDISKNSVLDINEEIWVCDKIDKLAGGKLI